MAGSQEGPDLAPSWRQQVQVTVTATPPGEPFPSGDHRTVGPPAAGAAKKRSCR